MHVVSVSGLKKKKEKLFAYVVNCLISDHPLVNRYVHT